MADLELCYLTATEALQRFRRRRLSPVELLDALIARAEAVEPAVNAFTYRHFDEARDAAKRAEARYARRARTGALEGLAVGIKDESYIAGLPTSNGSLLWRDFVPDKTSPVVGRILRAGGIAHARTATPEFSCNSVTWSKLWGVTRNPWNPAMTPGGSSGGSAAALAAGTCTLATGSDIGGSIRIPASTCGLVGFKPPYGRNPDDSPSNLDWYCHTGPLARSVADAMLLQNVMAGPHPLDVATLRPKLTLRRGRGSIKGWRIAVSMDLGFFEIAPEVRANTEAAIAVLRDCGAIVEEVNLDWDKRALDAGLAYLEHGFGTMIAEFAAGQERKLTNYARAFARKGSASTPARYVRTLASTNRMYASLGPILERHRLLLCPTTAVPAVPADLGRSAPREVVINGRSVDPLLGWVLTLPFNMLSRCPVMTLPSGRAPDGVPTGIQLVGRTYRDADVFEAAFAYEAAASELFISGRNRPKIVRRDPR